IFQDSKRFFVEKYKQLHQDDASGTAQNFYHITVIPDFVNKAVKLIQQSIIHVYHDDIQYKDTLTSESEVEAEEKKFKLVVDHLLK
ncbi:31656_t:CDS:2, partial [Racocetra persica]